MKRILLLFTSCVVVGSVAVAQKPETPLKETHNEAINKGVHLEKTSKSAIIEQDRQKEEALRAKSANQRYEASDESKAKWIEKNAREYRSETVQKDVTLPPALTPPGFKQPSAQALKDRPVYVDTGNPEQDRLNYEDAKNKWLKKNDPATYEKVRSAQK